MLPGWNSVAVSIHRAGWPFIAAFAVGAFLLWAIAGDFIGLVGLFLTLWCVYFFRDPERVTPQRPGLVVAPADGRITTIDEAVPPPELDLGTMPVPRISIFLSVMDVHIQRLPVSGRVVKRAYRPGKFINAALDKESADNERLGLSLQMADGRHVGVVQIAGLIARRILCDVYEGVEGLAGQRYGLIRFGSRVDVYLPQGTAAQVCLGQTVLGGETILADFASSSASPTGMVR